jgi:hypothetical protein
MGSPLSEPGRQNGESYHRRHIPRSFAIANTEVTLDQFYRMIKADTGLSYKHQNKYSSGPQSPAFGVSWFHAVRFCRGLSEQEGIPEDQMCYPPLDQIKESEGVLALPVDYLSRTGYRLPTEAEWEFACRAGSETSRFYGSDERLSGNYGWSLRNAEDRVRPVGLLKPNDLGMFDTYGNVWEWCQNRRGEAPILSPVEVVYDTSARVTSGTGNSDRILRGGSLSNRLEVLRSAQRDWLAANNSRNHIVGFRVARTVQTAE